MNYFEFAKAFWGLVGLAIIFVFYFLPAIIAGSRKHYNVDAITLLNLFTGWTLLGWIVSLVWAMTDNVPPKTATHRQKNNRMDNIRKEHYNDYLKEMQLRHQHRTRK